MRNQQISCSLLALKTFWYILKVEQETKCCWFIKKRNKAVQICPLNHKPFQHFSQPLNKTKTGENTFLCFASLRSVYVEQL
jgi:hypothetical protein